MSFGIGTRTAIDVGLGGIIAFATNPWGGSVFDGAAAAYSTRIPAGGIYGGPLLRVRRSSDNAEQDIYASAIPDANGNRFLDTTALLAFAGVNSAFVTTWYDQSGNGRHATQTTGTSQPRIVNAGVIDLLNNKPALYPGAAGTSATFVLPAISAPAFSAVINTSGAVPSLGGLFGCVIDNGARRGITQGLGWRAVSSVAADYAAATDWRVNGSTAVTTIDGVPGVSNLTGIDTVLSVQNGTTAALARLFASYVTPGRFYVGWCGEVIFFSSNFTAATSRQTLERNQGTAFGITVA